MHLETKVIAALVALTAVLAQTPANALPYYDGGRGLGGQNCGFSTWNQCMVTVRGIGGFCVPNQFYNPGQVSAERVRKKGQH